LSFFAGTLASGPKSPKSPRSPISSSGKASRASGVRFAPGNHNGRADGPVGRACIRKDSSRAAEGCGIPSIRAVAVLAAITSGVGPVASPAAAGRSTSIGIRKRVGRPEGPSRYAIGVGAALRAAQRAQVVAERLLTPRLLRIPRVPPRPPGPDCSSILVILVPKASREGRLFVPADERRHREANGGRVEQ
jgi:hypothetical protein